MLYLIGERAIHFHDAKTYEQFKGFVTHEGGYQGNVDKKLHDDAVMALSIAFTASGLEGPYRGARDAGLYNEAMGMFDLELA
jgi:hypothetical protein